VRKFTEDATDTFEGWLDYQGFDATAISPEQLEQLHKHYDEMMARVSVIPKVGRMKLRQVPNEYRYAVAVRDGADLWLTLWVKRSAKGEFFVFRPMPDDRSGWDPHTSYHLDGTVHMKSYDRAMIKVQQQPLTGPFQGTVPLGAHGGHSPKKVGAICDPEDFHGIVKVQPGILGPREGDVLVDLVEPGCEPISHPSTLVQRETFRDVTPWVVIRIFS